MYGLNCQWNGEKCNWGWINWYAGIFYEDVEACYEVMGGNIHIRVV